MGFPVGYTEVLLPRFLLHTLTLLGLFRAFLLALLHSLGLSSLLDPGPARPDPLPSLLIRDRLPVLQFSDALEASPAAAERCAVCLYEFLRGEDVRWPLNCRHIFHRACLDRWIDHDQRTCPLCRADLIGADLMEDFHQRLLLADQFHYFYHDGDHIPDHDPWPSH